MVLHVGDRDQDYAAAGFGQSLGRGAKPALILVDFARAYFDTASPLYAAVENERAAAARLRDAARAAGAPVVFSRVEYVPGDPTCDGGVFYRKIAALKAFDRGNPLGDFTPELAPTSGDIVITKQYPSAFFGTDLAVRLNALGVDTCVVAGLTTSGCVRATALDALCHRFAPLVVADACGDRDRATHDANLFDLAAKYADVIGAAEAVGYLEGRSGVAQIAPSVSSQGGARPPESPTPHGSKTRGTRGGCART
jgi:maleamate amidohydrolase